MAVVLLCKMNKDLERRIKDVRKYLDKQFEERPAKWWQTKTEWYFPLKDFDSGRFFHPQIPEETTIRFNYKRALIFSALFLLLPSAFFLLNGEFWTMQADPGTWLFYFIAVLLLSVFLLDKRKRGVLMIFNEHGFRIGDMPELICWQHLVAAYIMSRKAEEASGYSLLVYYYEVAKDEFKEIEISLNGLDMSKEDIASQIEYYRKTVV